MKSRSLAFLAAVAVGSGLFCNTAAAQVKYRCSQGGGSVYYSDRPCPQGGFQSYGATERERQTVPRSSSLPGPGRAPDHLSHLSPECAQLNDAIRTAPSRGVGYSTQRELREEYQAKCSDDDSAARQALNRERNEKRQAARDEKVQQQVARQRSEASRAQCDELLRILAQRRKRYETMTPGERADHDRSEGNYIERCKS